MYKYNIIIWKKNCYTNNDIPISHERERGERESERERGEREREGGRERET